MRAWESMERIMRRFGVNAPVSVIQLIQEMRKGDRLRLLYLVRTADGGKWVCRIFHEAGYPKSLVEQQDTLAEVFRRNGILTPLKLSCESGYCGLAFWEEREVCVTVEEYLEHEEKKFGEKDFFDFGCLMGCMHAVSEKNPVRIDYSAVSGEICTGRACFQKLLGHSSRPVPVSDVISRAAHLHDALVQRLKQCWGTLPHGAVQGDIGICNNLVYLEGRWGVIDFNLASDDPFLEDALSAFYSSLHEYKFREEEQILSDDELCGLFFRGYLTKRKLTEEERHVFPYMASLLDGLFFSKGLIKKWEKTADEAILTWFQEAWRRFLPEKHGYQKGWEQHEGNGSTDRNGIL